MNDLSQNTGLCILCFSVPHFLPILERNPQPYGLTVTSHILSCIYEPNVFMQENSTFSGTSYKAEHHEDTYQF